jgi:hypothetical protein
MTCSETRLCRQDDLGVILSDIVSKFRRAKRTGTSASIMTTSTGKASLKASAAHDYDSIGIQNRTE